MPIIKRFYGIHASARAWLLAELQKKYRKILVICKDRKSSEELSSDAEFFKKNFAVMSFPGWESLPFESISPPTDLSAHRLKTLFAIRTEAEFLVVTSADALSQKILPFNLLQDLVFELKVGQQVEKGKLIARFESAGFHQVSLAEQVGDMAVRGSIIDCFPSTCDSPIRIELKGREIKEIRNFDPASQRSLKSREGVSVLPVSERLDLAGREDLAYLLPLALERIKKRAEQLETPNSEFKRLINIVNSGLMHPGLEMLQAIYLGPLDSLLDCVSGDTLIVLDDQIALDDSFESHWNLVLEKHQQHSSQHYLCPEPSELYIQPQQIEEQLRRFEAVCIDSINLLEPEAGESSRSIHIPCASNIELKTELKSSVGSGRALKPLARQMELWRKEDFAIAFVVGSESRAKRLHNILLGINCDANQTQLSASEWLNIRTRVPVAILRGSLNLGFQLPGEKIVFISENEIFAGKSLRSGPSTTINLKKLLGSLAQLQSGDYVVHVDYGIGIYLGLQHVKVEGVISDLLLIQYADSKIYLPVQNIGKIQKFSAADGKLPQIDKLGSRRWINTKKKIRSALATLAGDLIKLYASRKLVKGWRYDPYGAEDERFADDFPFNETPDQLKAIQDTLNDMSKQTPMDRLICGDAGFGKTEVAMRAAYKALQHAKQVAVLAPTTLLAEQHKQTFIQRFAEYPARIAALSRFYKAASNKETLRQVALGEIDIIIGTHRLLQSDVHFHDLGLVIIDEEHRFGVRQKERLKQFKTQVDVLSLSATPIPRTLHMSLLGVRDISVIATPPQDRRSIRTYAAREDQNLTRDAILRELKRSGQCFLVHNRIQSIAAVTETLRKLIPEARFEFAHGQMKELQLEKIMNRFLQHEIDVLVSTTIIESGLDIPNANTIIVDRADTFGLAQLYQLRGRVGRGARQAYAYFLIPKGEKLGSEAHKRLKALQSLDDLGLGFNLALRDMEIRGVGNLLGKEQSGHVILVGFELYNRILKEAILNLKGEQLDLQDSLDPEVKLGVDAYFPELYIPDVSERLILYQRLACLESSQAADDLAAEIADRFGPYGLEVSNLIEIMRIRSILKAHGASKLELKRGKIHIQLSPLARVDLTRLHELIENSPETYSFTKPSTLGLAFDMDPQLYLAEICQNISEILELIMQRNTG